MADIGFIGLGIMGRGMVRNLLRAGHTVTVWNRTRRPLPPELGAARIADSLPDLVRGHDRVFLCLTGPDAQRDVYRGKDGLLAHLAAGTIVVDSTTTDPELTAELAAEAAEKRATVLDCPVFGSKGEAWEGRLDFVCGGSAEAFEAVKPLIEPMAASIHHLGPAASGAKMKLVGNLLVAAQMASLGEALSLVRKLGLPTDKVMGVLDVTDYSSALIRGVGRASLAGQFEPSFHLKNMLKDARLIGAFAKAQGVPVPVSAVIAELYQACVNKGFGEQNASALHRLNFELSGLDSDGKAPRP